MIIFRSDGVWTQISDTEFEEISGEIGCLSPGEGQPERKVIMELKVSTRLEQLLHFRLGPIWDGDLVSKLARDILFENGLIDRAEGFQFLTGKGVELLVQLGYLNESTMSKLTRNVQGTSERNGI